MSQAVMLGKSMLSLVQTVVVVAEVAGATSPALHAKAGTPGPAGVLVGSAVQSTNPICDLRTDANIRLGK